MMAEMRALCALGCLIAQNATLADAPLDTEGDRIAAHFEAMSSRLLPEDAAPLAQFVAKAGNIPGARLAVLVPETREPSRARFVAARVAELERRVPPLSEAAELRKVPSKVGSDLLWLAVILPPASSPAEKAGPLALQPPPQVKRETLAGLGEGPRLPPPNPADLRLSDWVIRGVKHPSQGPTYAYVAKVGSDETPREIVERQTDKELGLVRAISQSPEGTWIVSTEIGWIGQAPSSGALDAGGR